MTAMDHSTAHSLPASQSAARVSGLRPGEGGTLELTVAAPGIPLAKIDQPVAAAAKLDKGKNAVTDATWFGAKEGGEKKTGRKGRRGKKGSKKKGEEEGEGEEKEEEEKDED